MVLKWLSSNNSVHLYCRYQTRCHTKMVYHEMEEDYPKCQVEVVKSCRESEERGNKVDPTRDCKEVKVTRCRIARRKVRKAQPDTRCERVPRKTCVKRKCVSGKEKFEETVKMVKEFQPQESCTFTPRRVCQEGEDSACRPAVRRVCRQVEGGRVSMQLVCNGTLQEMP